MKQTLYPQPTTAECGFKLFRFKIYNFAFVGEAIPKLEIGGIKAYVRLQTFFWPTQILYFVHSAIK